MILYTFSKVRKAKRNDSNSKIKPFENVPSNHTSLTQPSSTGSEALPVSTQLYSGKRLLNNCLFTFTPTHTHPDRGRNGFHSSQFLLNVIKETLKKGHHTLLFWGEGPTQSLCDFELEEVRRINQLNPSLEGNFECRVLEFECVCSAQSNRIEPR